MKALTRLLLVNWHYFQNTVIDFGNINFLTGKNSAGKSTIIDALQVVLMGETRSVAFNRAASKKSERTLKSYLIGSMGEDIENGNKSLRDGKDFSTYIVAEFYDDFKSAFFCLGAVFDTFADGSDINRRFFWLKNSIPANSFIENGKTMDSRRMTQFFKEKYVNNNDEYDEAYRKIRDYELPNYREKIEKAKNDAMEQFKSDFIYKLRANIQSAEMKIDDLNNALKMAQFGNDKYRFSVEPNPAFLEYYNMLMSSLLDDGTEGLFSFNFTEKYKSVIDNLFEQIISFDSNSEKSTQSVKMFSKYQTYLTFDLITTDSSGRREKLSKSINTKSGGETQTPFYIAVLASFARLYRTNDPKETGNTMRLVIFDEAFNKMDGERIIESIKLLRKFGLQAIICSPPEKASDIAPIADKTQLVYKEAIGEVYRSTVVEWTKEMSEING